MVSFLKDVEEFHKKFGLEYDGKPRALDLQLGAFRHDFKHEELSEWQRSQFAVLRVLAQEQETDLAVAHHLEQQLDALVDLAYVLFGTAYLQGFGPIFEEAWRRVHAANMAKVRAERAEDSKRGSTFDVVKPEGWVAPDHFDLVNDHAHRK